MSGVRSVWPGLAGEVMKSRKPFTLDVIATEMLREKPSEVISALGFDMKRILECLVRRFATCDEGHSTWHQIFDVENQDYRVAIKWHELKDMYWKDGIGADDECMVDQTMIAFESFLDERYQPILFALFVKIAGTYLIFIEND